MKDVVQDCPLERVAPVPRLLLTEGQAADALGVSQRLLWSLVEAGDVRAVRIGRLKRFDVRDLLAFVDRLRDEQGEDRG